MAKELIKSNATIKAAKPKAAPYRLPDRSGLYLLVRPDGKKWWRLDYTHEGKRKPLSLGTYPDTGLALARTKAASERELVAAGIDPSDARQAKKTQRAQTQEIERRLAEGIPLADSFEAIGREWFEKFSAKWVPSHADKIIRRLERDFFPWVGNRPLAQIKAPELLATIQRIESRSAIDTAHRALQNCGQIFRYAIATGRAERDISTDLRGALPPKSKAHLTQRREMMQAWADYLDTLKVENEVPLKAKAA